MPKLTEQFAPFAKRMREEKLPEIVSRTFEHYYQQLVEGQTGFISEADIRPVSALPDAETFPEQLSEVGRRAST